MAEVKILVKEGHVYPKDNAEYASSVVTLIKENGLNIVVDPGMDRGALLSGLAQENLSVDEIDYVVLTHCHLDHSLLAGIFEKAKILE